MSATPDLSQLQATVDGWIRTVGNGYFGPLTNGLILAEETGEVCRILARLYGDQRPKPGDASGPEALADELADVIWVCAALANQTGTDLTEALARNLEKKTRRDRGRFADKKDINIE